MTTEHGQTYFDNPEIWSPAAWQNRAADYERAKLAAEWLPGEVRSVLDVGCGNGVFTNLVETNRFKVGLDLSRVALEYVTALRLQANASWLPFANNSFDASLSMEMLEHLPFPIYQSALNELVRVSRQYILVTVPYDENLNHNRVICPVCLCAFHPYHHVRRYHPSAFETMFGHHYRLVRLKPVVPIRREALPVLWNLISLYLHRQGRDYPHGVICPQCGFTPVKNTVSAKQVSGKSSMWQSLSRLWPKRTTFTWWMAFYRKET
jgi:SAM-dependent methyltransferase